MADTAVIKPLTSVETPNTSTTTTFGGNKLVRLTHAGAAGTHHVITCTDADSAVRWTIALTGGQDILLEKEPTDTITSNAGDTSITGTAVAFLN